MSLLPPLQGMTQKAIHLTIVKNIFEIFGKNIHTSRISTKRTTHDSDVALDDSCTGIDICVNLTEKVQQSFKILTVKGPKQNYLTLRPGWTDILFKLIVENTDIDCIFNFKKANIEQNEFSVQTRCIECQCELAVQSINNRTAVLMKKTKSNLPHSFKAKRRLTRERAVILRSKLQNDSDHNIHRGIVNEIPDDLNHLPRDFVSEKSLHSFKSLGKSNKETCVQEIFKLMSIPKFKNTKYILSTLFFGRLSNCFTMLKLLKNKS